MTLISIDFVYGIILSLMYAGHIPVLLVCCCQTCHIRMMLEFCAEIDNQIHIGLVIVHLLCHFNDFIVSCIAQ